MQLRSFFSLEGCDQGARTGALGLLAYGGSGTIALLFGAGHYLWGPGAVLGLLFALSLVRRCRDAHRPRGYLVAALVPFLLWLLVLSFGGNAALGLICFGLGLAMTLLISVLPAKPVKEYLDGYWHPDMPPKAQAAPRREPTLGSQATADVDGIAETDKYPREEDARFNSADADSDWAEGKPEPCFDETDAEAAVNRDLAVVPTRMAGVGEYSDAITYSREQGDFQEPEVPDVQGSEHSNDSPVWHRFTQRASPMVAEEPDIRRVYTSRDAELDDDADSPISEPAAPHRRPPRSWSDAFNGEGSLEALMEAIYFHLKRWWRFYLSGAAACLLVSAVVAISLRIGVDKAPSDAGREPVEVVVNGIQLASGLGVALEGQVLTLSFEAATADKGLVWSLSSAEGERHCASLLFNNGNRYRPLEVHAQGYQRLTRFSPLDTQAIVRDLALRGNVQLCGLGFSLKGSQALLEADQSFAAYLNP